jgi:hypothetical protein
MSLDRIDSTRMERDEVDVVLQGLAVLGGIAVMARIVWLRAYGSGHADGWRQGYLLAWGAAEEGLLQDLASGRLRVGSESEAGDYGEIPVAVPLMRDSNN